MNDPFRGSLEGALAKVARLRKEVASLEAATTLQIELEALENEQIKFELLGTPPPDEAATDRTRLTVIWGTACVFVGLPFLGLRGGEGRSLESMAALGWFAVLAFTSAAVATVVYLLWRQGVRTRRAYCLTRSIDLKAAAAKLRSEAATASAPAIANSAQTATTLEEALELAETLESRLEAIRARRESAG